MSHRKDPGTLRNLLGIAVAVLACSAALPALGRAQELPPVQAGGGYIYVKTPGELLRTPTGTTGGVALFGEVVGNLDELVAVVGHVAVGFYDAPSSRSQPGRARSETFLAGARFRSRCCANVTPFAQTMAGRMRSTWQFEEPASTPPLKHSYWGFLFGGGVDIKELHVAAELAKAHTLNREWTLRLTIGALFPSRN
jgi:hypothetical protein